MSGPRGSLFGAPPWISAVADTYGFRISADVLVGANGTPVAGLTHAEVHDLRGGRLSSLPFCDRLDPVVADVEQWNRLIDPVLALGLPVELRVLHEGPPMEDRRFASVGELAWHATDLERPEDEIFAGLHPQARQNLRSARRHGVSASFGSTLDDVRAFHDLHRSTRKAKYRLLAQPIEFFEHVWERFAPTGDLAVGLAMHDGAAIAGALYLVWDGVLYYKFGASLADRLSLRPNELLAWESMRLGQRRGCRSLDWGVSDLDQPGLVKYKRKYATEERRVHVLRHTPEDYDIRRRAEADRVLGEVTSLLTAPEVPDAVTQRAGEVLYRYFC